MRRGSAVEALRGAKGGCFEGLRGAKGGCSSGVSPSYLPKCELQRRGQRRQEK